MKNQIGSNLVHECSVLASFHRFITARLFGRYKVNENCAPNMNPYKCICRYTYTNVDIHAIVYTYIPGYYRFLPTVHFDLTFRLHQCYGLAAIARLLSSHYEGHLSALVGADWFP